MIQVSFLSEAGTELTFDGAFGKYRFFLKAVVSSAKKVP